MSPWLVPIAALAGYILGSVPVGIAVCALYGKDPRSTGSGRTGATNVYRTVGLPGGLTTLAGDILKGTLAVYLAGVMAPDPDISTWAESAAAVAAILGHNHSIFIGFRGGAGATPNLGALLGMYPPAFPVAALIGAAAWLGSRIASVATLSISGFVLATSMWLAVDAIRPPEVLLYGIGQFVLIAWALKPNIARLLRGQERRVSFSRQHVTGRLGSEAAEVHDERGGDG